ncbi:MAG: SRPBCC family protein [Actinobacteria bacterium]|nr:SRPBCC family protein [Actinomycetota bacterium]
MARFVTTVESSATPADAFELIANFSNIMSWDPGIGSAKRLDSGPIEVGSRFLVESVFGPRRIPLEYEVLEWIAPNFAVLQARTRDFTSYDVISVSKVPGGSAVTYDADLRLHGVRRVFDLPLLAAFQIIGRRAESGMRRELAKVAASTNRG